MKKTFSNEIAKNGVQATAQMLQSDESINNEKMKRFEDFTIDERKRLIADYIKCNGCKLFHSDNGNLIYGDLRSQWNVEKDDAITVFNEFDIAESLYRNAEDWKVYVEISDKFINRRRLILLTLTWKYSIQRFIYCDYREISESTETLKIEKESEN